MNGTGPLTWTLKRFIHSHFKRLKKRIKLSCLRFISQHRQFQPFKYTQLIEIQSVAAEVFKDCLLPAREVSTKRSKWTEVITQTELHEGKTSPECSGHFPVDVKASEQKQSPAAFFIRDKTNYVKSNFPENVQSSFLKTQSRAPPHTWTGCIVPQGQSLRVVSSFALTRPRLGDIEMTQVIRYALVFWELGEFGVLDLEPVLGSALGGMAVLLLRGHVGPADPVLVLRLDVQPLQRVAFHLPRDLPWTPVLSDPLLPGDAFPQQGEGEEHGSWLVLKE